MLNTLQKTWGALALGQRAALAAVLALVFLGVLWMAQVAGHPPYGILFSNLEPEDAGAVTSKLRELKVDYHLTDGGRAIEVPADKVYDLRLSLATEGLPRGGSVGFELFDKTNFGATDFTQHLNYQRALQGELTRTINQLDGVLDSRVHLAIPEKELFSDKEDPATASVVLHLRPGHQPDDRQVAGIVHLVASAVDGLKPENVTVYNAQGDLLSGGGTGAMYTENQVRMQEDYERRLESKLQRLVEEVLGPNRAAIRVSAEFNWDQTETTSETYHPSGSKGGNLPTEQQTTTEIYGRGSLRPPRGVPGITSNLQVPAAAADAAAAGQYSNTNVSNKYAVSKVVQRVLAAPGKIRRLSIAVLLDQSTPVGQRTALKQVLAAAAGLDVDSPAKGGRGDRIELLPLPFDKTVATAETKAADDAAKKSFQVEMTRNGAAVLVVLLVVIASFFLAKQLLAPQRELPGMSVDGLLDEPLSLSPAGQAAGTYASHAPRAVGGAESPSPPAAERMRQLASQRPDEVARQLQSWMTER